MPPFQNTTVRIPVHTNLFSIMSQITSLQRKLGFKLKENERFEKINFLSEEQKSVIQEYYYGPIDPYTLAPSEMKMFKTLWHDSKEGVVKVFIGIQDGLHHSFKANPLWREDDSAPKYVCHVEKGVSRIVGQILTNAKKEEGKPELPEVPALSYEELMKQMENEK